MPTQLDRSKILRSNAWTRQQTDALLALFNLETNIEGKRVAFIGDSIVGWSGGFAPEVTEQTGAFTYAFSFFGCRMSDGTGSAFEIALGKMSMASIANAIATGDFSTVKTGADDVFALTGIDLRPVADRLSQHDWATTDHLVVMFGTNDHFANIALGVASSTTVTQFYGAINHTVSTIQAAYPQLSIEFTTPIYRNPDSANGSGLFLGAYADAIIDRGKVHRTPVLDLNRSGGINQYNYLPYLPDGIHPSVLGTKRMADRIAPWLASLYSNAAGGAYAYDDTVVHTTGDETIDGIKTFLDNPIFAGGLPLFTGPAGTARGIQIQTDGVNRWAVIGAGDAELGGNTGTSLAIISADDLGVLLGFPIQINRATSVVTFQVRPIFGAATPWDSGNLTLVEGVWSPTPVNVTNVASSSATGCQYQRIGEWVHFRGRYDAAATAGAALCTLGIPLPVTSNLGVITDAAGSAVGITGTTVLSAKIQGDTTNNRLQADWVPPGTGSVAFIFEGSYRILPP